MMAHTLYARFTAKPASAATVERLITELAERVRQEPGNLAFDVYHQGDSTLEYFVFEAYSDSDALEAHASAAYSSAFNAAIGSHIEEGRTLLTPLRRVA